MTRCWLFFHDWAMWEDVVFTVRPNISNVVGMPIYDSETYKTDGQKRTCKRCGKKQQRIIQ